MNEGGRVKEKNPLKGYTEEGRKEGRTSRKEGRKEGRTPKKEGRKA